MPDKEGFPMPKDFFQEIDDAGGSGGTKGSIRQIILLVLLVLTAGLGYLYFFTGLIKPREQITGASPDKFAPQRQPLPPRPDQGAMEQPPEANPEDMQPAPAIAEKTAPPQASPQAKPALSPPPKEVAATTPMPAASPTPKPAVAPAPKPAPPTVQAKSAKGVKTEKKPAAKIHARVPAAPTPTAAKARKEERAKPVAVAAGKVAKIVKPSADKKRTAIKGTYTLLAGEFASERETEKARLKLEKQGISNVSVRKSKKAETMHRLFLADFANREAADAELRKLQPQTGSAFILNENGRHALYAGSYLHERGASREQKRLARKGVKLTLKTVKVSLPVSEVTAGSFAGSEEANKEAIRLKRKGIVVKVIKTGQ
jgi:hypothetical protein